MNITIKSKYPTWSQLIERRKLKNRNPKLIEFEDKVQGKEIARNLGCRVPETYHVTTDPTTIDFKKLPSRYVIKCAHLAGTQSVFLISDGTDLFTGKPISESRIIKVETVALKKRLNVNKNEWATTQIQPQIVVEELLPNLNDEWGVINDYKCYTFHGRVCLVKMDVSRNLKDAYTDYFTRECTLIDWDWICLRDNRKFQAIEKPDGWDQMIEWAERLGQHFKEVGCGSFIRVDFYLTPKGPVFGEFTIYPGSGARSKFKPWVDQYMGYLWKHPGKNNENLITAFEENDKNLRLYYKVPCNK